MDMSEDGKLACVTMNGTTSTSTPPIMGRDEVDGSGLRVGGIQAYVSPCLSDSEAKAQNLTQYWRFIPYSDLGSTDDDTSIEL